MSTVSSVMAHARAFLKVPATYAQVEEVRIANTVQGIIGMYYRWHWAAAAASNISLSIAGQDYTMAAGDQNTVLAVQSAYLTDASLTYPPMAIEGNYTLPLADAPGRPYAVGLLSPTAIRVFPKPSGNYTFHWRKHKRPTVLKMNTESYDCPGEFEAVVKAGVVWQVLDYGDDTRAENWQKTFYALLEEQKQAERRLTGRVR